MSSEDMRFSEEMYATDTLHIVVWVAYGSWKATSPFPSKERAEKHIEQHISRKDYNKQITIMSFPKPTADTPSFVNYTN